MKLIQLLKEQKLVVVVVDEAYTVLLGTEIGLW
jgi:hypothetical protein